LSTSSLGATINAQPISHIDIPSPYHITSIVPSSTVCHFCPVFQLYSSNFLIFAHHNIEGSNYWNRQSILNIRFQVEMELNVLSYNIHYFNRYYFECIPRKNLSAYEGAAYIYPSQPYLVGVLAQRVTIPY